MKFKYITPSETSFLVLLDRLTDAKGFKKARCQKLLNKMIASGRLSKVAAKEGRAIIGDAFGKSKDLC